MRRFLTLIIGALTASFALSSTAIEPSEVIPLWPDQPPGNIQIEGPERILEGRRRPFYQLTGISNPTLEVFLPAKEKRLGTAVLVCPGGGLQRLAYELEGLEVADWLTSRGIAAFVLKYRVPAPARIGLMDAQRAMGIIRSNAEEWEVDPNAVGQIGFSAGAEIGAWLATHWDERIYSKIDSSDEQSSRPDFVTMIYPGGLVEWRSRQIKGGIVSRINEQTPPMFLVHAFDDASENSLQFALALKRAKVASELHLYQQGGHGFGVRETGGPTGAWTERWMEWLGLLGFLDPAPVRHAANEIAKLLKEEKVSIALMDYMTEPTLADAYRVQKRFVNSKLSEDRIGGFKGAGASAAAQQSLRVDRPMTGVLFASGRQEVTDAEVTLDAAGEVMVETEIGYRVSVDISYYLRNDEQTKGAIDAIMPVIELPSASRSSGRPVQALDMVAVNIGSAGYLVGPSRGPDEIDPNGIAIQLSRDGATLHETDGASAKGGQWENLRSIINSVIEQGHVLRAGQIIISGALGGVHPGEAGEYEADFGQLGKITFELR